MLQKIIGKKVELLPKVPQENEEICPTCGGTGWLYEEEKGYIERCPNCYSGIVKLCPRCQKPIRGICTNEECRIQDDLDEENRRLEKALIFDYVDVPDECKEMMYSEVYGWNEGYFTEIEDLIEYCESEDIPIPEYCWSTYKIELSIDAESIVSSACEELHEDAYSNIVDEKGLQDFLDVWCDKQSGVDTYSVDYKYTIRVNK